MFAWHKSYTNSDQNTFLNLTFMFRSTYVVGHEAGGGSSCGVVGHTEFYFYFYFILRKCVAHGVLFVGRTHFFVQLWPMK